MPNPVPAAAEGLPEINRRRLLGNIAAASVASVVAGGSAAVAATYEAPPGAADIETMPIGALWMRALETAHELSDMLDRLNAGGDTIMVEVYSGSSGHPRVNFGNALPNDARAALAYYAKCYQQMAMAIEPDVTEWSHVIYADASVDSRFALIGSRKAVRS